MVLVPCPKRPLKEKMGRPPFPLRIFSSLYDVNLSFQIFFVLIAIAVNLIAETHLRIGLLPEDQTV